jgi:hypothetical protein
MLLPEKLDKSSDRDIFTPVVMMQRQTSPSCRCAQTSYPTNRKPNFSSISDHKTAQSFWPDGWSVLVNVFLFVFYFPRML